MFCVMYVFETSMTHDFALICLVSCTFTHAKCFYFYFYFYRVLATLNSLSIYARGLRKKDRKWKTKWEYLQWTAKKIKEDYVFKESVWLVGL